MVASGFGQRYLGMGGRLLTQPSALILVGKKTLGSNCATKPKKNTFIVDSEKREEEQTSLA